MSGEGTPADGGQRGLAFAGAVVAHEDDERVVAQLQALQQLQQHFAAAGRFGGEQHASGKLVEELGEGLQRLGGLGFDRQIRQRLRREAFAAGSSLHVLLAGDHPWPVFQAGEAVLHRQEQLGGWQ